VEKFVGMGVVILARGQGKCMVGGGSGRVLIAFRESDMRIFIAVDGSEHSDRVIQEAVGRPRPKGTEVAVVTVVDPFFFTKSALSLAEAKKTAQEALDGMAAPLQSAGWNVTTEVILDNPRHGLPKAAENWKADIILIGSHGLGTLARLVLGSTAQAVLRHAHCSVEIVRTRKNAAAPSKPGALRILIPTDGSPLAQRALQLAASAPWLDGSEIKVISCPEFPMVGGAFPYFGATESADLVKISEEHARQAVEEARKILGSSPVPFTAEVTEPRDTPAHGILAAAEQWPADLIVMGSHGRRGFDRAILGSVSETVAMHAGCSVEVIRGEIG
jgi:nucleotide-binding universal stress UspA family protein